MIAWIARDKNKRLWLYINRPTLVNGDFFLGYHTTELPENEFPEVTFENSPRKVKIKLIK